MIYDGEEDPCSFPLLDDITSGDLVFVSESDHD